MTAPPREFRAIAREIAKDSIVTQATARLIEQIVEELHNSRINPLCDRIEKLEAALRPFADVADLLDAETEGISDTDELDLYLYDYLAMRYEAGDFRSARAALNGE